MKTIERSRFFSASFVFLVSTAALAGAIAASCTQDMTIGGPLGQQGPGGGSGGAGGSGAGGSGGSGATFTCGTRTCSVGLEFCLMGPADSGHCAPLPTACAGSASCGCVCQTPGGGPGICPDPAQFNDGLGQCSCQNVGATTNVAVWCSLPAAGGSGGGGGTAGGAGGATGTAGAGGTGGATFACGDTTCSVGAEFCVIDPALAHCMPLPQSCAASITSSACGCACQTQNGGPGSCPDPAQFNEGGRQCSCQNAGATSSAVVWCQ